MGPSIAFSGLFLSLGCCWVTAPILLSELSLFVLSLYSGCLKVSSFLIAGDVRASARSIDFLSHLRLKRRECYLEAEDNTGHHSQCRSVPCRSLLPPVTHSVLLGV